MTDFVCKQCAECCTYGPTQLILNPNVKEHKDVIEFLNKRNVEHHGYWILTEDNTILLFTPVPCQHLVENKCNIYNDEDRPDYCKQFMCNRYRG